MAKPDKKSKPAAPRPLPSAGGTYIRGKGGTLRLVERTQPAPVAAPMAEQPAIDVALSSTPDGTAETAKED